MFNIGDGEFDDLVFYLLLHIMTFLICLLFIGIFRWFVVNSIHSTGFEQLSVPR